MDLDPVAFASLIASSILSVVAIVISLYTFKMTSAMQEYSNIDTLYQTLLNTGIDNPDLRNPDMTQEYIKSFTSNDPCKGTTVLQYETYALNVWNCCETICDDFLNYNEVKNRRLVEKDKKYKDDWESWKPALIVEAKLHGNWFKENESKFEPNFVKAIKLLLEQISANPQSQKSQGEEK